MRSPFAAAASTWAWLRTFPRFEALGGCMPLKVPPLGRGPAAGAVVLGGLGLAAIGIWPQTLFSLLWLAPLARGDWRALLQPAAAALVCGFFWELWNWGSLARAAVMALVERSFCRRPDAAFSYPGIGAIR